MVTEAEQTILVTGASSGIGLAVSTLLLDDGFTVIGISRKICTGHINHPNFIALQCDLRDFEQIDNCIKSILKSRPLIMGAVFCAGEGYFGGLEQLNFKRIQALIDLNLLAPMLISKLLVPHLKTAKMGHLIYIGSEAALQGAKNGTAYCASKFGLRGFVQALSAECSQAGVKLSLINPGMVDTAFFDKLHFKPGPDNNNAIDPTTIAKSVQYVLNTKANTLVEEINLSPRNKVVVFK